MVKKTTNHISSRRTKITDIIPPKNLIFLTFLINLLIAVFRVSSLQSEFQMDFISVKQKIMLKDNELCSMYSYLDLNGVNACVRLK